jgi:hypothetical protein
MESRKIGIVQNNMTSAINANDDEYDQYLRRNHAHKIEAIHAKHQGFDVCLLPMMDPQRMPPQNISEMTLKEHCCRICAVRTRYLCRYTDRRGKAIHCGLADPTRSPHQAAMNRACQDLASQYEQKCNKTMMWQLKIIEKHTLYYLNEGEDEHGEPFQHYAHTVDGETDKRLRVIPKTLLQKALNQYILLISNLLGKIGDVASVRESCVELRALMTHKDATYAKTQLPALDWFANILDQIPAPTWRAVPWYARLEILGKVICASYLKEGPNDSAFLGHFHTTTGFILSILEDGMTPHGVMNMLKTRNAPDKYRRKTGEINDQSIQYARELCRGLVNTVMPTDDLERLDGCTVVGSRNGAGSAEDAFAEMAAEAAVRPSKYDGFAKRMSNQDSTAGTFTEMIDDINGNRIVKVEVETTGASTALVANTTMSPDDLSTKGHVWRFNKNEHSRFNGFCEVSHIYHYQHGRFNNVFFIIKGARDTLSMYPLKGNCCFPEFLASKHRTAERPFEELNKKTDVQIPESGPIALGIGNSVGYQDNRLVRPITLRLTSKNGNVRALTLHNV